MNHSEFEPKPEVIVQSFRQLRPGAVRLAQCASLAARVEPELLRRLRIEIIPEVDASAEADLWFSPLVQIGSPVGLVLVPEIAQHLRYELLGEPVLIDRVRAVLLREHQNAPRAIQIEERLLYLSLLPASPEIDKEVERLLAEIIHACRTPGREGVAGWAEQALAQLPPRLQELEAAQFLVVVVRMLTTGRLHLPKPMGKHHIPSWLPWALPSDLTRVSVGLRLGRQSLEVGGPEIAGAHCLDLPETRPLVLEVRASDCYVITFEKGEQRAIPFVEDQAELRTVLGERFLLKRRQGRVIQEPGFNSIAQEHQPVRRDVRLSEISTPRNENEGAHEQLRITSRQEDLTNDKLEERNREHATSSTSDQHPPSDSHLRLGLLWNDARFGPITVPDEDSELIELLAWALSAVTNELNAGYHFEARLVGETIYVDISPGGAGIYVVMCNGSTQGGILTRQLEQARNESKGRIPVVVRTMDFPSNPKTTSAMALGKLLREGGRRAVLSDNDCRTMIALRAFGKRYEHRADFAAWLNSERPLTHIKALREILNLEHLRPMARSESVSAQPRTTQLEFKPSANAKAPPSLRSVPIPTMPYRKFEPLRIGEMSSLLREPVLFNPDELARHAIFLGSTGSGKTTLSLNVIEQLALQGVPAILVDLKGDLAGYASEAFWTSALTDPLRAARQAALRERLDVALFTPGHPGGRPLAIPIVPDGLDALPDFDRQQATRHAAEALAGMLDYRQSPKDKSCRTLLAQAIDQYVQLTRESVSLDRLVKFIGDKDPRLVNAVGRLDVKLFDKLADDLDRLRLDAKMLLDSGAEKLDMDLLLGRGAHAIPGRTRLSIISTKFLGDNNNVIFWVSQLLIEVTRWLGRNPSPTLQAAILFDEADLYLPAMRQPSTKQPMENLLKRARSAGLGLMLATQNPGDFDYKYRDNIRTWFIGRVKEKVALDKMKPMLSAARVDPAKIPGQVAGEFHVVRDNQVEHFNAEPSILNIEQFSDEQILQIASSRPI
ncbi:ATP-binding protein [Cystobacter fuscus]|uniref:ATP-binding protein n=1 Tax=Cystobacter fuscus TaxID=43 RepID=UPI002B2A33C9|nr:ATP-binding protein [Cystobacter fuscus]